MTEYGPDPAAAETQPVRGALFPGIEIEIRDDDDRPAPLGQPGRIRLLSPVMMNSYLEDPQTTAQMFHDGWFYPGDQGLLHPQGRGGPARIEVLGRTDDILNLGGIKVLADDIEEMVRARVPAADIGVCVLPDREGIEELWIGVAYDAPDDRGIIDYMRPALTGFPYGHAHLVKLAAIPRTDLGKIRRAELRKAILSLARADEA